MENELIQLEETVMVSDPCYEEPTWCQIKLNDVKSGNYYVGCEKVDDRTWGERCGILYAVHEDYKDQDLHWINYRGGEVGVDSGQAGIFSYDTFRKDGLDIQTPTDTYDGRGFEYPWRDKEGDEWYEKMCKFTLSPKQWGVYYKGIVSSSGIGDGSYRCIVARKDNKIVGIVIDFYMKSFSLKSLNRIIWKKN